MRLYLEKYKTELEMLHRFD